MFLVNVAKNQPVVTFSVGRNLTFLPEAVDGKFLTHLHNGELQDSI